MADIRIHSNPTVLNRTLKTQREMYKRQVEGIKSEYAKKDALELGLSLNQAQNMMYVLKSDVLNSLENTIAVLDHQKINNIVTSDALRIYKGGGFDRPSRYPEHPELLAFYNELHSKALAYLTNKKITSQELMWTTASLANELRYQFNHKTNVFTSYADVQESYQHFKSGKHGLTVFDLETFGGKNQYGKQQVDKIFEYTFDFYDSSLPGANRERIAGFVGLSAEEAGKYEDIFQNYRDFGSLSEKEQVIARSLAKIGHVDTIIEEDPEKRGRFIVKKYGDAGDVVTKEQVLAGIREARRIGEIQERYLYNGMLAWEEDIANAILRMQKEDSTIAGHNISRADIPWLNQVLTQHSSENMKQYMRSQGFGGHIELPRHRVLDTLSMLQLADANPQTRKELWPQDKVSSILRKKGLTHYQQEALVERFFPELLEATSTGAHAATFDVEALHKLLTEARLGDKQFFDRVMELAAESHDATRMAKSLKANKQQLFYATSSIGGKHIADSVFGFKVDNFTGNLRTMDGVELAETLGASRTFPEYMTKKGVTYTIDSIELIKPNKDYINRMKEINPSLAVNELVGVKISPVVDTSNLAPYADLIQKNTEPSYLVAPRENIENLFNRNFIMFAEQDKSGEYKLIEGAGELLRKQTFVEQDGKVTLKAVESENLVKEIIRDGTFININDSAARNIREDSYKRYEALSRFSEEINKMIENDTSDLSEAEKKRSAIQRLLESSKQVAKATSEGQAHTLGSQDNPVALLEDILGYKDFKTGKQVVHPRTIDNAIANLEYYESIADDIKLVISEVDKRTKNSSEAEKFYLFSQGVEALRAKSLEKMEKTNADLIDGFVRNFESDYFEVDISSLQKDKKGVPLVKAAEDINPEGILKIHLRPGGEHRLIRSLIGDDATRFNTEQEAIKRLTEFVSTLQKEEGLLKGFFGKNDKFKARYLQSTTATSFARDIIEELNKVREEDPTAGYISVNRIHTTLGASEYAGILTDQEKLEALEERFANHRPGMVLEINKDQTPEGQRSRRNQAIQIVDEFLMDPFDEKTLTSYGYTSKQIENLRKTREIRRRDYIDYVESLLSGVSKTSMEIVMDRKTNVFGLVSKDGFIDLSNVPRDRFTDGIFYTQIGRNRVATELHLLTDGNPANTRLGSAISVAMRDAGWDLESSVDRAIRQGRDPEERILQWISKMASSIREGSSITMLDEQDMKSQFELYEKHVIDALPKMTGLNTLGLTREEEFLEMVSSEYFEFDRLNDTQKQLWALNREKVLKHVAQQSQDSFIIELVNNISSRAKHSAFEVGRVRTDPVQSELEYYNRAMRDIENQIRYLAFREDYAKAQMEELEIADYVDLGSPLRTRLGHNMATRVYEGTTQRAYTEFVTDRVALTSAQYKEKLIQAKRAMTNAEEIKAIDTLLIRGNLTEGGAIGSARIADALFQNYDRQKISFARELFLEHEDNVKRFEALDSLRKVVPEIVITEDGQIGFEYKKGRIVKEGEKLFDLKGYGDSITPVGAKYDGVLRFGFFTKAQSMLVDEEDVVKHVSELAKQRGMTIKTRDQFLSLAEELYDANFYVERLSVEPYRKVMEDRVEKHMTAFAYYGLGESGNEKILKALSGLGLEGQKGKILDKQFFDELLDGKSVSSGVLSDMSTLEGGITEEVYTQAIKDAGFKNKEEFREALIRERYLPSDVLTKHLGAPMVMLGEDVKHQNRAVPITTAVYDLLHRETEKVIEETGASREEARVVAARRLHERLSDVFIDEGQPGLRLASDGKFEVPLTSFYGNDYIDTSKLRKIYDEEFAGEKKFDDLLETDVVSRHSFALQQDFTGRSRASVLERPKVVVTKDGRIIAKELSDEQKILRELYVGAKITDREINMLESNRFDQTLIDRMASELSPEDFRKAFGHVVDEVDGEFVLKDKFESKPILGDFTDEVRRNQFVKSGEALITPEMIPDKHYLKPVVQALSDVSGGNVGLQTAEEVYSIGMNTLAMRFNEGQISMDELKRKGFQVMSLSEIDRVTGGDGSYLLNESAQSLFGKNIIIDLEDQYIAPELISKTKHGSRYIALGAMPIGKVGENLIQEEPHRIVGSLISMRNRLMDTSALTDKELEFYHDNIIESIDSFNKAISKAVFGKQGLIRGVSEVRLERSTSGKASLMDIHDILDKKGFPDILDRVYVDGKSLMGHHRSGVLMDFKIMSYEQFKDMGIFDENYLKQIGLTEEELKAELRSGVMGFSHRSPTIYEGSVRPTMLILSDELHGNQAIEYAPGALSSHMDSDGDMPRTWLASYTGKDGKTVDAIQYKALQKRGEFVDDHIAQAYSNQKAMMYRNAVIVNRHFAEKIKNEIVELGEIDKRIEDKIANKLIAQNSLSVSGRMRPGLERKATPEEAAKYLEKYQEVEKIAISQIIDDTPSLKALSEMNETKARAEALKSFKESTDTHIEYLRKAIDTLDPSVQEDYAKAAEYHLYSIQDIATEMSKLKRSSAGEINLPIYQINKIINLTDGVLDSDQRRFMTHILEASEEAFLSPKHSEAQIIENALTMKEFNRAIRAISGSPLQGDTAGPQLLEEWFKKNLPKRFDFKRFSDMYSSEEKAYQDAAKLTQKVFNDRDNIQNYNMFLLAVGSRNDGIDPSRIREALLFPEESKDMISQTYRALEAIEGLDAGYTSRSTQRKRIYANGDEAFNRLESEWAPPTDASLGESSKSLLSNIRQKIAQSNITGKDLAFGALGIAGAVMVAGFVGGNPARPATTHAAAESSSGLYEIPALADEGLSVMPSTSGGYVININANTEQGREHVQEAIEQALAQSYNSTNINVSMNIRDSSGNITDRNIEEIIRGSFL